MQADQSWLARRLASASREMAKWSPGKRALFRHSRATRPQPKDPS